MFVFGNFVRAAAGVLDIALNIYMWIVIISAFLSWVNPDPYNPIVRFLRNVTEPVYDFIRRRLPLPPLPVDFTPMIVILGIMFLRMFLVQTLLDAAGRIQ
jgi:YggT family protein